MPRDQDSAPRPRIVIVGAGFAGINAAKRLRRLDAEITVIDRHNHHLFQPLLYQVATAGLSPAEIAWPIRQILSRQKNARVILGEVVGVDRQARTVALRDGKTVPYDMLVLATGARHSYFGHDDWAEHAPGLKAIEDATAMRRRILLAFERAETAESEAERRRQLTFVVVGGGPTGVELAGTLAELARRALAADFRRIDPKATRIVLAEAGPRILAAMPPEMSDFAEKALAKMDVEVLTGGMVTALGPDGVTIEREGRDPERLAAATVLWAAGNEASPAGRWIGAETNEAGQVAVAPDLTVPGHPEIFVIGDTALVRGEDGAPVPGIAPAARQQGQYVARVIRARLTGAPPPAPFRYVDTGIWATIGRNAAVIVWKGFKLKGRLAWWLWGLVHVLFLMEMRDRVIVAIRWLWAYVSFGRGARLITETPAPAETERDDKAAAA